MNDMDKIVKHGWDGDGSPVTEEEPLTGVQPDPCTDGISVPAPGVVQAHEHNEMKCDPPFVHVFTKLSDPCRCGTSRFPLQKESFEEEFIFRPIREAIEEMNRVSPPVCARTGAHSYPIGTSIDPICTFCNEPKSRHDAIRELERFVAENKRRPAASWPPIEPVCNRCGELRSKHLIHCRTALFVSRLVSSREESGSLILDFEVRMPAPTDYISANITVPAKDKT